MLRVSAFKGSLHFRRIVYKFPEDGTLGVSKRIDGNLDGYHRGPIGIFESRDSFPVTVVGFLAEHVRIYFG